MTAAPSSPDFDEAPASFGYRDVARADKAGLVKGVFDRVADRYDVMNDLMSMGVHRVWKDMLVTRANPQPGETLVDIAGGTGDVARRWITRGKAAARRRGGPAPTAIVCDINAAMLEAGRQRDDDPALSWVCGDAERLPLPDANADAVTIAFGVRNVTDRAAALADMRRVLKPGGRFLCLEFSRPANAAMNALYDAWSFKVIPRIGRLAAGDADSYCYLVESIRRFPDQDTFAGELRAAGFERVNYTSYSSGVVAVHAGWKL